MTTRAQLSKAALALGEVEENRDGDHARYVVQGSVFVERSGDQVWLALANDAVSELVAQEPAARVEQSRGGASIELTEINGQALNYWVRRAWIAWAPERLAGESSAAGAAGAARAGSVGDLPASIGNPATRGLVGAGITTLAQVAERTDVELLAIHGVGPKAVRLLREARG